MNGRGTAVHSTGISWQMVDTAFTVSRLSLYGTALSSPCPFPARRLGVSKVLGETQPGLLTKGMCMPFNGMLNNQSSGKGGEQSREGHAYGILIPKQPLHMPWEVGKSGRKKGN